MTKDEQIKKLQEELQTAEDANKENIQTIQYLNTELDKANERTMQINAKLKALVQDSMVPLLENIENTIKIGRKSINFDLMKRDFPSVTKEQKEQE